MDWVQVFSIVFITATIVAPMALNGKPKSAVSARYDWYDGFISAVALSPLYGRIFGYW